MEKTISVLIKEPGKDAYRAEIDNTLESLQSEVGGYVGGYIEAVTIADGLVLICDEEGKLKNKTPNFSFAGDVFVGTVLLAGTDGEDFATLPECTEELIELISPQLVKA